MPEPADQPALSKRPRSLTSFYIAIGVFMALALFGAWFWRTWNVWWFDAAEAQRRQAEAAQQLGLSVEKVVDLGDGAKLVLVLIPAGRFRMGAQAGEDDDLDIGYQWVQISKPFYLGKYEVTQEVWEKVMGDNPSQFKGAKNPVDSVNWGDCQEFLKRLNQLSSHPVPSPGGRGRKGEGTFRLPTEAEWEWACRAGTTTRFCFGDDEVPLGDYAWYAGPIRGPTHPVGTKKPNAWGLHDMHGNVWEWCGDWHEDYVCGWWPKADPTGPVTGDSRVLRGGCFLNEARSCRSASRPYNYFPESRDPARGFRLVLSSSRTR